MDILTAIHSRRSVRRYDETPLSEEDIRILLSAAMTAPSAGNQQAWQFIVVTNQALLKKIADIHPHATLLPKATAGILVCGDVNAERSPGNWMLDCSAATQNILLAGVARGIGTVWLAVYPSPELVSAVQGIFGLPEHIVPLSLVSAGYSTATEHKDRYDQAKVHYNHW